MTVKDESRYAVSPREVKGMDTVLLRDTFLIETLFELDIVRWVYTHYDRYMAGGIMTVKEAVKLEAIDEVKAGFLWERRELGGINVGGRGKGRGRGGHVRGKEGG